jgi:DNA-binding transcriptional MocR family regulator
MSIAAKTPINLQRGYPSPDLLPATQIKAASQAAFRDADTFQTGLLYGEEAGYEPLRRYLAGWLTDFYQPPEPINPLRLAITGGASQNLACILQTFSDPMYSNVWLVSPVYFLACGIFEDNGFHGQMRSVPEDAEGIDIQFLQRELAESDNKAKAQGKVKPVSGRPL